jgi:hypothetical protein
VRPWRSYRFAYPIDDFDVAKIAYFFDYDMADTAPPSAVAALEAAVRVWRERWQREPRPQLRYARGPGCIKIIDRRGIDGGRNRAWRVDGDDALIYEACVETYHTAETIADTASRLSGSRLNAAAVDAALGRFCGTGVMAEDGGQYLALAVPLNRSW